MNEADALKLAVDAAKAAQLAAEQAVTRAPDWLTVIERLPALVITLTVLLVLALNWKRLTAMLDRLSSFKAMGFEVELSARSEIQKALSSSDKELRVQTTVSGEKKKIHISEDDETRALKRAASASEIVNNRNILWLDDMPSNNLHEVRLLQLIGLHVAQVESNEEAMNHLLAADPKFQVVISDIGRPDGQPTGTDFLEDCLRADIEVPIIFYISEIDPRIPMPMGAFGVTNRPDELLHLVLDALERIRPLG